MNGIFPDSVHGRASVAELHVLKPSVHFLGPSGCGIIEVLECSETEENGGSITILPLEKHCSSFQ